MNFDDQDKEVNDIVDKLMDLINKDIRANNTNIKFLEQQISEQNRSCQRWLQRNY